MLLLYCITSIVYIMICTNYQVSCIAAAANLNVSENSRETVIEFLGQAAFVRVGRVTGTTTFCWALFKLGQYTKTPGQYDMLGGVCVS
jgi:hypothetical protein